MKYKLIFDSTVGHPKEEIEKAGAGFVPINLTINKKDYLIGVDIDAKWVRDNLQGEDIAKTSAVSLGEIKQAYDDALKTHNHVVYISISKGLSSSKANAEMVANEDEYKGKITVVDSEFITPILQPIAFDLIKKSKTLKLEEFLKILNFYNKDIVVFALPGNMKRLYKSGRVTKTQYIIGSLLKVNPIITYADGDMTTRPAEKARGLVKATEKALKMFIKEIDKPEYENVMIVPGIISFGPKSEWFTKEVTKVLVEAGIPQDLHYNTELDAAPTAHIGSELYAIVLNKKQNKEVKDEN